MAKYFLGGRMDWNQSRFTKLGLANREDSLCQIDIVTIQVYRFADPHARNREQPQ